MATLEEKIVHLVQRQGGAFDLSSLIDMYKETYGESLPKGNGEKTSKWLQQFDSLILVKVAKGNRHFLYLKEYVNNINDVLSNAGLNIVTLSENYKAKFGEGIPIPKGIELSTWLKCLDLFQVKNGPNSMPIFSIKQKSCLNIVVTSATQLEDFLALNKDAAIQSLHYETFGDNTTVLTLFCPKFCAIIDCHRFEMELLDSILGLHLKKASTIIVHDIHKVSQVFDKLGLSSLRKLALFDTQLAMEVVTENVNTNLFEMAHALKTPTQFNDWKRSKNKEVNRPLLLKDPLVTYAMDKAKIIYEAKNVLNEQMLPDQLINVLSASVIRSEMESRDIRFRVEKDFQMCSMEVAHYFFRDEIITKCNTITVHHEPESILSILPPIMRDELVRIGTDHISDLSLDIARRPLCWWKGERKWLPIQDSGNVLRRITQNVEEDVVNECHVNEIMRKIGFIGTDNRAGFDGALHRVSCVKNRQDKIIGFTIRFGRHVSGNVDMIRDLLCKSDSKSILFLGEPGSGKTTIVREAIKMLAENENVFVVDTSNEIAGDGNLPHRCIGYARRMMVKQLKDQANVMVECVQNHTPSTMVIDEIGRSAEVLAAKTSKHRGVRMIASAHGDFRSLVKNKDLNGLIGGLQTITLGDKEARDEADRKGFTDINKQKTQRAGSPIFETVIELRRGMYNEWVIINDAATAVDNILDGKQYDVQRRIRDPKRGSFYVEKDKM